MEMLAGWRAVSLAGNDKGRVYTSPFTAVTRTCAGASKASDHRHEPRPEASRGDHPPL